MLWSRGRHAAARSGLLPENYRRRRVYIPIPAARSKPNRFKAEQTRMPPRPGFCARLRNKLGRGATRHPVFTPTLCSHAAPRPVPPQRPRQRRPSHCALAPAAHAHSAQRALTEDPMTRAPRIPNSSNLDAQFYVLRVLFWRQSGSVGRACDC